MQQLRIEPGTKQLSGPVSKNRVKEKKKEIAI
jgi:hypothetical protein